MLETQIAMRLRDLNTAAHVDNVEVLRVADEARVLFLGGSPGVAGQEGVLSALPPDVVVLVVAQHAQFRHELRWAPGRTYAVRAWVAHVGSSSFAIDTEIRTTRDEPDAVCETTIALMDSRTGRPWALSDQVRAALAAVSAPPVALRPRPGS